MNIYADYDVYVEREDSDDWPDLWHKDAERWFRPHKLTLVLRQRAVDEAPRIVRAWAICQKRWANSKRLTPIHSWYSVNVWEVDGTVPAWLSPYIAEALSRILPVKVVAE